MALANPDGFEANSRYNARGVDLNRNCSAQWRAESVEPSGPRPWSEPESRALRDFILAYAPAKIVSLHWALAEIDADGPQSTGLARRMWHAMAPEERAPYRIRVAEQDGDLQALQNLDGFCPGSFGQWCGYELRFSGGLRPAMVTLELPYRSRARIAGPIPSPMAISPTCTPAGARTRPLTWRRCSRACTACSRPPAATHADRFGGYRGVCGSTPFPASGDIRRPQKSRNAADPDRSRGNGECGRRGLQKPRE